jgi:hypothetical protein
MDTKNKYIKVFGNNTHTIPAHPHPKRYETPHSTNHTHTPPKRHEKQTR